MDAMATSQPLAEMDINVGSTQELIVGSEKKNRNIWKEQYKIALVNELYLDECCPIGKCTHKEVNEAWITLVRALRARGDGLFDEFHLSIPTLRRQMKELLRKQKELNREAITSTSLGRARMHTNLEASAQHLLELQYRLDATRQQKRRESLEAGAARRIRARSSKAVDGNAWKEAEAIWRKRERFWTLRETCEWMGFRRKSGSSRGICHDCHGVVH